MNKIWVVILISFTSLALILFIAFKIYYPVDRAQVLSSNPQTNAPLASISPAAAPVSKVKIFLIALNDNGKSGIPIGCDDSLVFIEKEIPKTETPLNDAISYLLNSKNKLFEDTQFYNSLYQSNLKIDSIKIVRGIAKIDLSGDLNLGGVCDNPRLEYQLKQTAFQFSTVKTTAITINSKPLQEIVSGK